MQSVSRVLCSFVSGSKGTDLDMMLLLARTQEKNCEHAPKQTCNESRSEPNHCCGRNQDIYHAMSSAFGTDNYELQILPWARCRKMWYLIVSCSLWVLEQPRASWTLAAMNSRQDMVPCGFLQIAGAGAAKGQLKISSKEYRARCCKMWYLLVFCCL